MKCIGALPKLLVDRSVRLLIPRRTINEYVLYPPLIGTNIWSFSVPGHVGSSGKRVVVVDRLVEVVDVLVSEVDVDVVELLVEVVDVLVVDVLVVDVLVVDVERLVDVVLDEVLVVLVEVVDVLVDVDVAILYPYLLAISIASNSSASAPGCVVLCVVRL